MTVPVGHSFDRPIGSVEVHGDIHVANAGRHKIRWVGFALSWVEGQGRGRWGEGGVIYCDVERLVLSPQSQTSSLGSGHWRFETDRPAR